MSIFDQQVADYDAWYETAAGTAALAAESATLAPLLEGLPQPWLEIGVGTGRFASTLGVTFGIDPAHGALILARCRGVQVAVARGEHLPFRDATFGAALVVVTLCFVEDPKAVLREARRVVRPGGALVLGIVPSDSPLGARYQERGRAGHPYYSRARFYSRGDIDALLANVGMRRLRTRSTLINVVNDIVAPLEILDTDHSGAGFIAVRAA